jgi:hypothetical protein
MSKKHTKSRHKVVVRKMILKIFTPVGKEHEARDTALFTGQPQTKGGKWKKAIKSK